MEIDRLNFFTPFRRLEPNHENQLTRALLVVLRYSPMAHATWLRLIAPTRELQRLPTPAFVTQRRAVRYAADDEAEAELISVYLAPEEPLGEDQVVVESVRGQVLDAVIDYGGAVIVVVENKVAEANDYQARNINVDRARVRIVEDQRRVEVLWRDVLEAFVGLRERGLISGAEATLLDDFVTYVEDYFPSLGPFRTMALCQGDSGRQQRRLRQLLGEATEAEAVRSAHGPLVSLESDLLASIYLRINGDEDAVELVCYPADTLSQARAFYRRTDVIEAVMQLADQPGWQAGPNFHFGFREAGFCWSYGSLSLDAYLALWQRRIAEGEGAVRREHWEAYWAELVALGVVDPADEPEFHRRFTHTNRDNAVPRPGLWIARRWATTDAEVLDSSGLLVEQVREALQDAVQACQARVELESPALS